MSKHITSNGDHIVDQTDRSTSYVTLVLEGDLGGGTIDLFSLVGESVCRVPNSRLDASTKDQNNFQVMRIGYQAVGQTRLSLSGATNADFKATVQ